MNTGIFFSMIVEIALLMIVLVLIFERRQLRQSIRELNQSIVDSERANRQEMNENLTRFSETVLKRMTDIATLQKNHFDSFVPSIIAYFKI